MPDLSIEKKKNNLNYDLIAGVDEAGRGPLAGPVVAACVIFERNCVIEGVKDSKKISEKKRERLFDEIYNNAIEIGVGVVHEDVIDNNFSPIGPKPRLLNREFTSNDQKLVHQLENFNRLNLVQNLPDKKEACNMLALVCLLYTSDAADE